jgi:hypothetical protein
MKEIIGNIWVQAKYPAYIVIPTNGVVKHNGECVMGRGLAYQAKIKYPDLPKELGGYIKDHGNIVFVFCEYNLLTFPVKHMYNQKADISLINESAKQLREILLDKFWLSPVYIPHVGCGNGGLLWSDVKPIIEQYFGDLENIIICDSG